MICINNKTKLYSVLKLKCPKCHQGNLFINNAWNYHNTLAMPDKCFVCRQDFKIEPGFYSGALWVTYPIVLIVVFLSLFPLIFIPDYYLMVFLVMLLVVLVTQPFVMRYGRAIWINIFIHYDIGYEQ
ncbi:MAG: DUF983 domain-containing protein [Bacteroidetes bacterium]|nr:MAG: DUF983 domain-containing protein [Bacteroidota bacterium]